MHLLAIVLLLVIIPVSISAQTPSVAARLTSLQAFLEENGPSGAVTPTMTVKYTQTIESFDGCHVAIRSVDENEVAPQDRVFEVSLEALTPAVTVKPWADQPLYSVTLNSSSGSDDIPLTSTMNGEPLADGNGQRSRFLELAFSDASVARRVAAEFSSVIRQCGGRPRTPAAERRTANAEAEKKKDVDRLLGKHISPTEKARLIRVCQERARAKLKSPSSARFPEPPSVSGTDSGGALIYGTLEAQNGFGGYGEMTYLCSVDRFGKQLVPGEVSVY